MVVTGSERNPEETVAADTQSVIFCVRSIRNPEGYLFLHVRDKTSGEARFMSSTGPL